MSSRADDNDKTADTYWIEIAKQRTNDRDLEGAETALLKAIEINSSVPEYHVQLGVTYERLGDVHRAYEKYQDALALDQTNAELWMSIATVSIKLGKKGKALETSKRAVVLDTESSYFWMLRGSILSELEMFDEAQDAFLTAINLDSEDVWVRFNYAILCHRRGDSDQAVREAKKAIQGRPNSPLFWEHLARFHHGCKQYEEGEEAARRSIELDPEHPLAYYTLGTILEELDRYSEATNAYYEAIEHNPQNPVFHYALGRLFDNLGYKDEAIGELLEATKINPDYKAAHKILERISLREDEDSIFIHDNRERLVLILSYANQLQSIFWKDLEGVKDVSVSPLRVGGQYDQTHYVIKGLTVQVQGGKLDRILELVDKANQEWDAFVTVQQHDDGADVNILSIRGMSEGE
jgi:tetratricopeptide (TPR) repeat protein